MPEILLNLFQAEKKRYGYKQRSNALKASKKWLKSCILYLIYLGKTCRNIYTFISYFRKYDCLIFIYGNSFYLKSNLVFFNDLFWLKLFRIKTIFLMCGSDSRPSYLDAALICTLGEVNQFNLIKTTNDTQKNNQFIEKYATYIISNVFSSYFFTKPIIAAQCIGYCTNEIKSPPQKLEASSEKKNVKILHAPSVADIKGTMEIKRVVHSLIDEGVKIEFKIITGVTNQEVLEEIQQCDFVIDQLYSDVPLAGFAAEAASLMKPSIVGSYIPKDYFAAAYQDLGLPPSLVCHPENLKEAILLMINDKNYRLSLGKSAYDYATSMISPIRVAERYVNLIQGNFPKKWLVNAQSFLSVLPLGMSEDKMIDMIKQVNTSFPEQVLKNKNMLDAFCKKNKISPGQIHEWEHHKSALELTEAEIF